MVMTCLFFFFKQKTAYEMRISDWSSDVCSSDLNPVFLKPNHDLLPMLRIAYAAVRTWSTHIYSSFPLSREGRGQRLFRFARDFAPADIAAAETAGEVELVDRGIGVRLRLGYGAPRSGAVEHAPARRDDPAVAARRARLEDSHSAPFGVCAAVGHQLGRAHV